MSVVVEEPIVTETVRRTWDNGVFGWGVRRYLSKSSFLRESRLFP